VRADGGDRRRIFQAPACCVGSPTYSPDGKRIAFSGTPRSEEKYGIWTIRSDGTDLRRLTTHYRDGSPSYSPDGRWIAFQRRRGDKGIVMMRADGTRERTLSNTFFNFAPAFAPAGDRIAALRVSFTPTKEACGSAVVLTRSGSQVNVLAPGISANLARTCVGSVS
jgi:TolB protein